MATPEWEQPKEEEEEEEEKEDVWFWNIREGEYYNQLLKINYDLECCQLIFDGEGSKDIQSKCKKPYFSNSRPVHI